MVTLAAAALGGAIGAGHAAQGGADTAHGYWLTQNGKAIVLMKPCGAETCGKMVWVADPLTDEGQPKRDIKNANGAKRARRICGLPLLGGMKAKRAGVWRDGWIYNPRNGKTYDVEVEAVSRDKLEVRGYLGVKLLGKSQVWTRVADDRGGCPA